MERQVSSVVGLLIVVAVSVIMGFVLLRQSDALDETYATVPQALDNLKILQESLKSQEVE